MKVFKVGENRLSVDLLSEIISNKINLSISSEAKKRIKNSNNYLKNKIKSSRDPIYGINTGFGSLYDKKISKDDLGNLQNNLVMSHACGLGDEVPCEIAN